MYKVFILLVISLKVMAAGVETAKIYDCKSTRSQLNFKLRMLGESMVLYAPLFGECKGRAFIVGGDAHWHIAAATLGGGTCLKGINLKWYGNGLEPGKKFNLQLTGVSSNEDYLCVRIVDREQYELFKSR